MTDKEKIEKLTGYIRQLKTKNEILKDKLETRMNQLHETEAVVGDVYSILCNYYKDN